MQCQCRCRQNVQENFHEKTTSNLVMHLQRFHKEPYSAYTEGEQTKKCSQQGVDLKRKAEGSAASEFERGQKLRTLELCLFGKTDE